MILCAFVSVVLLEAPASGPASSSAQDVGVEVAIHVSPATVRARSAVFGADKVDQHTAAIDRGQTYIATLGPSLLALALDGRVILVDRGLGARTGDEATIRDLLPTSLHLDLARTSLPPLYARVLRRATIGTTGTARLCADIRRLDADVGGRCVEVPPRHHRAGTRTHLLSAGAAQVHAVAVDRTPCASKQAGNWGLYAFDLDGFSLATDMTATRCARPPATSEPRPFAAIDALVLSLRSPHVPTGQLHLAAAVRPAIVVATHRGSLANPGALRRLRAHLAEAGMPRLPRVLQLSHRDEGRSIVRLGTTATP